MPPVDPSDLKGLRVDAVLADARTGETKWIDVSVVNTERTNTERERERDRPKREKEKKEREKDRETQTREI